MAEFKTSKEQKKWQALEASSKGSLEKVLKGTATPSDYQKVSGILKQYDQLAGRVFEQGVQAIEDAAAKVIEKIQEDRERKGKAPLDEEAAQKLLDLALQRQFDDFGPELVETIDAMLDRKLAAQDERNEKRQASHFQRLTEVVQAPDTYKAALREVLEAQGSTIDEEDRRASEQREILLDQIEERVERAVNRVFTSLVQQVKNKGTAEETQRRSPFSLLKGLVGRAKDKLAVVGTSVRGTATQLISAMTPKGENAVVQNSQKQANFTELLSNKLNSIFDWTKKRASSQEEREDKQENRWLRKLKLGGFTRSALGKGKSAGTSPNWIGKVLRGAMLALLAPGLIKTISSTLGEWFSWDKIQTTLGDWWKNIDDTGGKLLDWVTDKVTKIDYKGIAKSLWDAFTDLFNPAKSDVNKGPIAKQVQQSKPASPGATFGEYDSIGGEGLLAGFAADETKPVPKKNPQDVLKAGPTKPIGDASLLGSQSVGNAAFAKTQQDITIPTGNSLIPSGASGTQGAGSTTGYKFTTGRGRSSVFNQSNAYNFSVDGLTRSKPVNSVVFKPGVATEDPLTQMAQEANKQRTQAQALYQSRATIGLGSIPLLSGVNQTLGLINLGVAG